MCHARQFQEVHKWISTFNDIQRDIHFKILSGELFNKGRLIYWNGSL